MIKKEIKSVKGLSIGDTFIWLGNEYEIMSFPSRTTLCAKNLDKKPTAPLILREKVKKVINTI